MKKAGATKMVNDDEDNHSLHREESITSGIYDVNQLRSSVNAKNNPSVQNQDTFASHDESILLTADEGGDDFMCIDVCCNASENPTQLYLRLHYRLWDMALISLQSKPSDSGVWITTKEDKVLPIHVACRSNSCPPKIVEALLAANPSTLECATQRDGSLPLHLMCANDHFLRDQEALILHMIELYPNALHSHNNHNQSPLQVLKQHRKSGSTVPHKCQNLQDKIEGKISLKMTPNASPSSLENHTTLLHKKEPASRQTVYPELPSPSNNASDDGIASHLNKMALLKEQKKVSNDEIAIEYRVPAVESRVSSSLDSMVTIRPAKPIREEDEREYYSPSMIRESDGGVQFRDQSMILDESSHSEDEQTHQVTSSTMAQVHLRLAKITKENGLLRQKLIELTQKTTTLESNNENQCSLIHDLQQSVERERDISKTQVKEYEMKLARMQDQFLDTQKQLQRKIEHEMKYSQKLSQLESLVADKSADVSTLRREIKKRDVHRGNLEESLESRQSENENLRHEISVCNKNVEQLHNQLEESKRDTSTYKEIIESNHSKIKDLSNSLKEKEIQCRALTDALGATEKKVEKLEKLKSVLKVKVNDLVDTLKANTETFKSAIATLEESLQQKEENEQQMKKNLEEHQAIIQSRDEQIKQLLDAQSLLESSCESFRQKEKLSQDIANQLAEVTMDRDHLNSNLKECEGTIQKLSGEIRGLQIESAQKSGTLEESDRRMQALYTELVAHRQRENELTEKNAQLMQNLDKLAHDEETKSVKLRVLKNAVDSYKREIERFVEEKAKNDLEVTENVKNSLNLEQRLQTEFQRATELRNKLTSVLQSENEAKQECMQLRSECQQVRAQCQEAKAECKRAKEDYQQARMEWQQARAECQQLHAECSELKLQSQSYINELGHKQEEVVELRQQLECEKKSIATLRDSLQLLDAKRNEENQKRVTSEEEKNQLNAVCIQHAKLEEELRLECENARNSDRLQSSLVVDLEVKLSELKTKYDSLCEDHERIRCMTEKGSALVDSKLLDEIAAQYADRLAELERENAKLQDSYMSALENVANAKSINVDYLQTKEQLNQARREVQSLQHNLKCAHQSLQTLEIDYKTLQKSCQDFNVLKSRCEQSSAIIETLTMMNCENLFYLQNMNELGDDNRKNERESELLRNCVQLDTDLKQSKEAFQNVSKELESNCNEIIQLKERICFLENDALMKQNCLWEKQNIEAELKNEIIEVKKKLQENLLTVMELRRQLESLKEDRQMQQSRLYEKQNDENLLDHELVEVRHKYQTVCHELEASEKLIDNLEQSLTLSTLDLQKQLQQLLQNKARNSDEIGAAEVMSHGSSRLKQSMSYEDAVMSLKNEISKQVELSRDKDRLQNNERKGFEKKLMAMENELKHQMELQREVAENQHAIKVRAYEEKICNLRDEMRKKMEDFSEIEIHRKSQIQRYEKKVSFLEQTVDKLRCTINEQNSMLDRRAEQINELSKERQHLKTSVDSFVAKSVRYQEAEEDLQESKELFQDASKELENASKILVDMRNRIETLEKDSVAKRNQLIEKEKRERELESELFVVKQEAQKYLTSLTTLEQQIKSLEENIEIQRSQLHEKQMIGEAHDNELKQFKFEYEDSCTKLRESEKHVHDLEQSLALTKSDLNKQLEQLLEKDTLNEDLKAKAESMVVDLNAKLLKQSIGFEEEIASLKSEISKHMDLIRDKEMVQRNQREEYENKLSMMESELRQQMELECEITEKQHALKTRAYEEKICNLQADIRKNMEDFNHSDAYLKSQIKQFEKKIAFLERTVEKLRSTINDQNAMLDRNSDQINELSKERQALKASVDSLSKASQDNQAEPDQESNKLMDELKACKKSNEVNVITIASLEKCLSDVRKDTDFQRKELKRFKDLCKTHEEALKQCQIVIEGSQGEIDGLHSMENVDGAEKLKSYCTGLHKSMAKLQQDLGKEREENKKCRLHCKSLQESIIKLQKDLEVERDEHKKCGLHCKSLQEEITRLRKDLDIAQEQHLNCGLQDTTSSLQKNLDTEQEEHKKCLSYCQTLQDSISELQKNLDLEREERNRYLSHCNSMQESITELQKDLVIERNEHRKCELRCNTLEESLENLRQESGIERNEHVRCMECSKQFQVENRRLVNEIKQLSDEITNIPTGRQLQNSEVDLLKNDLQQYEAMVKEFMEKLSFILAHSSPLAESLEKRKSHSQAISMQNWRELIDMIDAIGSFVSELTITRRELQDEVDKLQKAYIIQESRCKSSDAALRDLRENMTRRDEAYAIESNCMKTALTALESSVNRHQKELGEKCDECQRLVHERKKSETELMELKSKQHDLETQVVRLTKELQESAQEREGLHDLSGKHELESVSMTSSIVELEETVSDLRKRLEEKCEEYQRCEDQKNKYQMEWYSVNATYNTLEASFNEIQKELEQLREEYRLSTELLQKNQIEKEKILGANNSLQEQFYELDSRFQAQIMELDTIRKDHLEAKNQCEEIFKKLQDLLSKVDSSNIKCDKEPKNPDQKSGMEDSAESISSSDPSRLLMESLEFHVLNLVSAHQLLLTEVDELRRTLVERENQVMELSDISDRLVEFSGKVAEESSRLDMDRSAEWDQQIVDIVSQYQDQQQHKQEEEDNDGEDEEELVRKHVEDRALFREKLRRRVMVTFERQSRLIRDHQKEANRREERLQKYERKIQDLSTRMHTLKLENKILKAGGKQRDVKANEAFTDLQRENEQLKKAIVKLSHQTVEHQNKISELAAKQASLQRRRIAAATAAGGAGTGGGAGEGGVEGGGQGEGGVEGGRGEHPKTATDTTANNNITTSVLSPVSSRPSILKQQRRFSQKAGGVSNTSTSNEDVFLATTPTLAGEDKTTTVVAMAAAAATSRTTKTIMAPSDEDMGSLTFSADSQDGEEGNDSPSYNNTTKEGKDNSALTEEAQGGTNVEVILLETSGENC